jgi:putative NADH-flavin reductase
VKPGLLLLGATGLTGRHLLAGALERGHEVTVLVRDPGKLTAEHPRLRTVVGSATDPATVDDALAGRDAVLCALGTRSPSSLLRCRLMTDSMRALVPAMRRRGASRLVLLSALGVGHSADHAPLALRAAFRTVFRQVGRDKAAAEEYVRAGDLDWTVVYPPALTDDPPSGDYRSGRALAVKGLPRISRADVAHFMLSQLSDTAFSRDIAIVAPRA